MAKMVLNKNLADPTRFKVLILSCPKTGNTWLRWLIHNAYGMPIEDIPLVWSEASASKLPPSFVTHQHLWPTAEVVDWAVRNNAVVLTTVRHPGDTLLSYFHYAQWQDLTDDPAAASMKKDGGKPGTHTFKYAKHSFAQAYSMSLAWAALGAHVVRYEDLLVDPVAELRRLTTKMAPLDEYKIRAAALLCKPEQMTRPGLVDPRHIHSGTARRWAVELPEDFVEAMSGMEPFRTATAQFGYDWDRDKPAPRAFDYDTIDPFRGRDRFDNGEPIGPSLAKVYLHEAPNGPERWPDPTVTAGDSFWGWLIAPHEDAALNPELPPGTFTNLMAVVHRMRPDVAASFPDPLHADRVGYLSWFLGQAGSEFEFPWGLIAPIVDAQMEYFAGLVRMQAKLSPGRISRIAVLNARGDETSAFECGEEMRVELTIVLDRPVENGVLGFSLRAGEGRVVFGTNTTMLRSPLPTLPAGSHTCEIRTRLTIPPQSCYVSVGLAQYAAGKAVAVHRIYDHKRITVTGPGSSGPGWCETAVTLHSKG